MIRSVRRLALTAVLACAACGGGATVGGGPGQVLATATPSVAATVTATPAPTGSVSPSATPSAAVSAAPTTSPTPLAIAADSVFASIGTPGVEAFTTAGTAITTYASSSGSDDVALDASGNTYVLAASGFAVTVARYAIGAQQPNATYQPTSPRPQILFAGGNGTLVVAGVSSDANGNPTAVFDVWDPRVTGAPSRTLVRPIATLGLLNGAIATDGTFYLPYSDSAGQVHYDVIAPGASMPSRTIDEAVATANTNFSIAAMAVAADGTLLVCEWTYAATDTNAGLYVYPSTGAESLVQTGASNPTSVGLDGNANIYITNSNATVGPDSNLTTDTLHALTIFAPHATSMTRSVTSGLDDPQNIAVDDDGTAYIVDDANADQATSPIQVVRPGTSAAATFAATNDATSVVLYDGTSVRSTRIVHGGRSSGSRFRRHRQSAKR